MMTGQDVLPVRFPDGFDIRKAGARWVAAGALIGGALPPAIVVRIVAHEAGEPLANAGFLFVTLAVVINYTFLPTIGLVWLGRFICGRIGPIPRWSMLLAGAAMGVCVIPWIGGSEYTPDLGYWLVPTGLLCGMMAGIGAIKLAEWVRIVLGPRTANAPPAAPAPRDAAAQARPRKIITAEGWCFVALRASMYAPLPFIAVATVQRFYEHFTTDDGLLWSFIVLQILYLYLFAVLFCAMIAALWAALAHTVAMTIKRDSLIVGTLIGGALPAVILLTVFKTPESAFVESGSDALGVAQNAAIAVGSGLLGAYLALRHELRLSHDA